MYKSVLQQAAQHYGTTPGQFVPLPGGHFASVYQFSREGRPCVLRITPPNEEIDEGAARAILAWMHYLAEGGGAVTRPALSAGGRLLEVVEGADGLYLLAAFEKAPGVPAETLDADQWSESLYRELGRAVGRMHALSREYAPDESLRRPAWDEIGNCFNPGQPLDPAQAIVREKWDQVWQYIQALPRDVDGYGLVHTDLHAGNFYVEPASGRVTLFDFDDCAYGWYAMDVVMPLLDMLVLHAGPGHKDFAARFLKHFLQGYRSENRLSDFWVGQLPHFLRLLEIGLYIQLHRHYDPGDRESWVGRFMLGRQACIEQDWPYVRIDVADFKEIER